MRRFRARPVLLLLVALVLCTVYLVPCVIVPSLNRRSMVEIMSPTTWFGGGGVSGSSLVNVEEHGEYIHYTTRITLRNLDNRAQSIWL